MIVTIILIVLIIIGIVIYNYFKEDYDNTGLVVTGIMLQIIGGILLFTYIVEMSLASYEYHQLVVKRDSLQSSLDSAREYTVDLERAAILQDIAQFNTHLAELKYDNTTFVFDAIIDDRVETIEPLK